MPKSRRQLVSTPDGSKLAVDVFDAGSDDVILLIAGGGQSMDWWDDDWCTSLVAGGLSVIRYDHRDTGESTNWPVGQPGYTAKELAADPLMILDDLGIASAHIAGMSMGGGIAQKIAIFNQERIRTLTLIATSPAGPGADDNGLPPIAEKVLASFEHPEPEPDWGDPAAVVAYRVAIEKPYAGWLEAVESRIHLIAEREVSRTPDMAASVTNHFVIEGGWSPREQLGTITAPTLVIHGTADPMFPLGHGEALVREISNATLIPIEGMGHEIPPPASRPVVIPAIISHTTASSL